MYAVELSRPSLAAAAEQLRTSPGPSAVADNASALSAKLTCERATLQSCAGIVYRDPGLALILLRAANSEQFNQDRQPVLNLARAAAMLGTDTLAAIVSSVPCGILPHPAHELSALLLIAAHITQKLVTLIEPRWSEEAYLSGLLRNIGELVFALEKPEEYGRLLVQSHGHMATFRAACKANAGFDFDELTATLLSSWSLCGAPALAARSSIEALIQRGRSMENDIAIAATTAHIMTAAMFRCETTERESLMRGATLPLQQIFHLTDGQAHWLCERAYEALPQAISREKLRLSHWHAYRPEPVAGQSPVNSLRSVLEQAIGLNLDRAALLQMGPNGLALYDSCGAWTDTDAARLPELIIPRKPPFLLVFAQRQDVWIDFTRDFRFCDTALAQLLAPEIFFLLPVVRQGRVRGALYCDTNNLRDRQPEDILHALMRLRDTIADQMLGV